MANVKEEPSVFDSKQIYFLTGGKGSGKTTGAFSFLRKADYSRTFYVDTEDSASDILRGNEQLGLKIGKYVRAYERIPKDVDIIGQLSQGKVPWVTEKEKGALIQFYNWFIATLNSELTNNRYDTFILDTTEPLEAAITAYVEESKQKVGWSGQRAYGRMETEGVRPMLDNLFEGIHRRGVKRIILTSHTKSVWADNKPILNKVEPGGRLAVWTRVSTCMFWLVPNFENEDGAPAALVLKGRFEKRELDKDTGFVKPRRILPQRMPRFSYYDMLEYEKRPANLKDPQPNELPTPEEREMMSEFLNDAQMRLMVLGAETELAQATPAFNLTPNGEDAGMSLPERLRRQREQNGTSE